jgi:hypothetical protein
MGALSPALGAGHSNLSNPATSCVESPIAGLGSVTFWVIFHSICSYFTLFFAAPRSIFGKTTLPIRQRACMFKIPKKTQVKTKGSSRLTTISLVALAAVCLLLVSIATSHSAAVSG